MNGTKRTLNSKEKQFLNVWFFRYGSRNIIKYRNAPEIILQAYKDDLIADGRTLPIDSDTKRLEQIKEYINYITIDRAKWRRFLKMHGLQGWQVGIMLGYKTAKTWNKSQLRYMYIRAILQLIENHEKLLKSLAGE